MTFVFVCLFDWFFFETLRNKNTIRKKSNLQEKRNYHHVFVQYL